MDGPDRYRLLGTPRDPTRFLFVEVEALEPVEIPTAEIDVPVAPGFLCELSLDWNRGEPAVIETTVVERTVLSFVDGVSNLFEAALDAFEEARREDLAATSRLTYDTGRDPVGALYAFAEQPGARDLFEEFRTGTLPLEPLLARSETEVPPPYEVFVMRPVEHRFVLVYVVFERDSILADTVRDTYDCPRPTPSVP